MRIGLFAPLAETDALPRYRDAGVDQLIVVIFAVDRDGLRSTLDGLTKSFVEPAAAL